MPYPPRHCRLTWGDWKRNRLGETQGRPARAFFFSALIFTITLSLCLHTSIGRCLESSSAKSMSHLTGTFLNPEARDAQPLIDQTHLGVVRIGILPVIFAKYARDPGRFDWKRLDEVITAYSSRTLMITISSTYLRPGGVETPIPGTPKELDTFLAFVSRIALHHANQIEYWQLDNEVTAPKNWPSDRYADYARLLAAFHDTVRKTNPEAKIVVAGVLAGDINGRRAEDLLQALAQGAAGKVHAIDIHYHRSWVEAGSIADYIAALRKLLGAYRGLEKLEIVVAENSTWFEKPAGRHLQTESQQAAYAAESIYAALAEGARFCVFGAPTDRLSWKGQSEHRFALNGLFFNPEKRYSAGQRKEGAKRVAFTMRLIAELTKDVTPEQIKRIATTPRDISRIEVTGKRPYSVLWWSGSGTTIEVQVPVAADAKAARIVGSVPDKDLKWPPTDPYEAFPRISAAVRGGMVTVRLSPHVPVIVLPERQ